MINDFYETDRAVAEYLLFHYGTSEQMLPFDCGPVGALHFPIRCVTECVDSTLLPPQASALDLGCAVGRATFTLGRYCVRVVGIDHSQRFIAAASRLQRIGFVDFEYADEGDLSLRAVAAVPPDIDRQRVSFEQGDAMDLRPDLGAFDVVLLANLIDRLSDPHRCLQRLPKLVKPGGQLIITSPYTWLTEYTPKENWLGGFERDGKRIKTLDTLKNLLSANFQFSFCKNLPFLIREHARKFQWNVAEASVWLRK